MTLVSCIPRISILLSFLSLYLIDAKQYILETKTLRTQADAEQFCKDSYGTNLATIFDLEEQQALEAIISAGNLNFTYIGLNDISEERFANKTGWVFTTGEPQNIEFFSNGEPNNNSGNQDCVSIDLNLKSVRNGAKIAWADKSCSSTYQTACDDAINPRFHIILNQQLSYTQAQSFCEQNFQSNLATVRNIQEQDYLEGIMGDNQIWIGMNDFESDGQFVWNSGIAVTFTNFNETGGLSERVESCIEVVGKSKALELNGTIGSWVDANCNITKRFACDGNFLAKVGGVVTTFQPTTSGPTTVQEPVTSDNNKEENEIFIIAGASVGAMFLVFIAGVVIIHRRRSRNAKSSEFDKLGTSTSIRNTYAAYLSPSHYLHHTHRPQGQHPKTFKQIRDHDLEPHTPIQVPPPPGLDINLNQTRILMISPKQM